MKHELDMTIEEISHKPNDSLVTLRVANGIRRDSILWLSALGSQVTGLRVGQVIRVTAETVDGK